MSKTACCVSRSRSNIKQSSNQPTLKSTKTAAGARYVPIPAELQKQLDMKSRYFFHVENGRMLSMTKMRRMWHSFYRACDIAAGAELYRNAVVKHAFDPAITPHYLRHTYCTNLRRQGVDLKTAQYLMGHAEASAPPPIFNKPTSPSEDVRGSEDRFLNTLPTSLLFLLVLCAVCAVKCTFCFLRFSEHFPQQIPKSLKDRKNPVISDGICIGGH